MKNSILKKAVSILLVSSMTVAIFSQNNFLRNSKVYASEVEYTDNFEKDSSENYISSGAGITVDNGKITVTGDGVVGLNDKIWYNGTYEFEICVSGKSEWAGVQFNKPTPTAQRDEAGYMLYVRANGSVELYTGKNGVIGSGTVDLGTEKKVKLKIVTTDGKISVYANDNEKALFEVKNDEYSYGYFSFVNYMEGKVSYDNLKITCEASDGKVKKIFLEMPDNMVALGKGETVKLDVQVLPLDAQSNDFEWKITDVYGYESTLATISNEGYITAGNCEGTVRIEVVSKSDKTIKDSIEIAVVEEPQRPYVEIEKKKENNYSNDFSNSDSDFVAYRAGANIADGALNLKAQGITMTSFDNHIWGDGTYEFDMDIGDVEEWAGVMICRNANTDIWDDSGYMLLVKPNGDFQFGYCGWFTPIAEGKISDYKSGFNHYSIVKNDENIKIYVNNNKTPIVNVKDSRYTDGYMAFTASSGWDTEKNAKYDNLSIKPEASVVNNDENVQIDSLYIVGEYGCNTVKVGSVLNIKACATPYINTKEVLTYTVENVDNIGESLATIDNNGVLTAGACKGKVKITATTASGKYAETIIEIVEKVDAKAINVVAHKNARVMSVGKEIQMYCNMNPANAENGDVEWSVWNTDGSSTDMASISDSGLLKAEKTGTVRIRASLKDDNSIYSEWIMTISKATNNGELVVPSMKYSFFAHYVADLTTDVNGSVITDPNVLANTFDVEAYADKMAAMGVEYVVFTAWHYRMVCLYDSQVMKDWGMENHRTDRDLLGEMIDAVNAKGINVVLYTHAFDGYDFKTAEEGLKVGWGSALKPALSPNYNGDFDYDKWNNFVNDVYGEVMENYGDRICGIWVDEGNMFEGMSKAVDFKRLINTIKSYNENIATFQNDHGFLYGFKYRIEEYWKHNEFADYSGKLLRTFTHKVPNPIISNNWWTSTSVNTANAVPYSGKVLFLYQVLQSGASSGGGIQWAAGPYPGEGCLYEPGVVEAMEVMNAYLNPIAWTIKGTLASTSYITKDNRNINTVGWGIATKSTDDKTEYIHVLNPKDKAVSGNKITLPIPADGKMFIEAHLAINNKKVTISQDEKGVYITLPDDENWSETDTVIELKVGGKVVDDEDDSEKESTQLVKNQDKRSIPWWLLAMVSIVFAATIAGVFFLKSKNKGKA